MAKLGLALQIIGFGMILYGGFRAAQDLGATGRWADSARLRGKAYGLVVRQWWRSTVLRKKAVNVATGSIDLTLGPMTASAQGTVRSPWEGLDADERIERLKVQVDGLRGLVDRNQSEASGRLDAVQGALDEMAASVDERFEGHDARDETILAWELSGGACSLLGTVLAIFG